MKDAVVSFHNIKVSVPANTINSAAAECEYSTKLTPVLATGYDPK
jgi:hypothetical protein